MPGAWEIRHNTSVLCAILHVDTTTVAWSLGLRNLQLPGGAVMPLCGMPYDHARNVACMRALESGVEWLFFIDSDVVAPHDTVPRLIRHQRPIISGVYFRRSPPHGVPVMIRAGTGWVTDAAEINSGKVIEVDVVGAGCLLIHRSILEKMPAQRPGKHWFDWRVDLQGLMPQGECLSEDFTFCTHVKRQLGHPILVDTSIHCRHIGYGEATYGTFKPLDCTPVT